MIDNIYLDIELEVVTHAVNSTKESTHATFTEQLYCSLLINAINPKTVSQGRFHESNDGSNVRRGSSSTASRDESSSEHLE